MSIKTITVVACAVLGLSASIASAATGADEGSGWARRVSRHTHVAHYRAANRTSDAQDQMMAWPKPDAVPSYWSHAGAGTGY